MAGGKYTSFVPVTDAGSSKYVRLKEQFNDRAAGEAGKLYGGQTSNAAAAAVAATEAVTRMSMKTNNADLQLFPNGVDLSYQGHGGTDPISVPDISAKTDLSKVAGAPANAYVPDVRSPGAAAGSTDVNGGKPTLNVDPLAREGKFVAPTDVKPNYDAGAPGLKSPAATSTVVGNPAIGGGLIPGSSGG